MSDIQEYLTRSLARSGAGVSFADFQSVVVRLLDKGILVHGDSNRETELYHIADRAEDVLIDYLAVTGCRLVHDRTFQYFRLYPPGAQIPGMISHDSEYDTAFRANVPANVVAAAVVLRFLYGKALQQGRLDDDAEVQVSIEEFFTSMQTLLKRDVKNKTERTAMFSQLRAMRVIRYSSDEDLTNLDAWMIVRPAITGLVSEMALETLINGSAAVATAGDGGAATADSEAPTVSGKTAAAAVADSDLEDAAEDVTQDEADEEDQHAD